MNTQTSTTLINLTIDGIAVSVPKGTTIYHAAKQIGINIPIFCYQDRMPPFGACRMCLVEVEKMNKLQTACTLEVTEGMNIKTKSENAIKGRESIVEFLLLNHPLDCPICDKGGECPLQEQAFSHGPGESRFFEEKRHFEKPLPLGPVLMLDRERCIICARCTRFSDEIAADNALEFIDRGFKTEVGTPDGQPAKSKFIGNTIAICPVGALTSQVYRFRARPWDNDATDSTCTLCPVGCSLILDSRDGEIMRTRSQENPAVNDIWLCDKGWFGYEYVYSQQRLQMPLIRNNGQLEPASWEDALSFIATKIKEFKSQGKIAGWGGNPLTTEENYLFQKLIREVIGVNHVDSRIGTPLLDKSAEAIQPGMEISIGECENLSHVILFGVDLTEEFPVIWLRLKKAINNGAKVIFVGHFAPEIAPHLAGKFIHTPGLELEAITQHLSTFSRTIKDKKAALFVGRQYLSTANRKSILNQLLKFTNSNTNCSLNILEGRGNSMGALFAGMHPAFNTLGKPSSNPGLNPLQVLEKASTTGWDMLYVAGANPSKKFPEKLWQEARQKIKFLVVQDLFLTETAQEADVVLPTLSYVEKGGHFINIEGRVQTLRPGKELPNNLLSDGDIFIQLAQKLNANLEIDMSFLKVLENEKIPIQRNSFEDSTPLQTKPIPGKFYASFAPALFDNGVRMKHDPHVFELAKEPFLLIHPLDAIKIKIQSGDVVRLKSEEGFIEAMIKLDSKVAEGTVVIPIGFDKINPYNLSKNLINGCEIEIIK